MDSAERASCKNHATNCMHRCTSKTACAENNYSTRLTAEYLSACNKIFESGFLLKYCVSNQNQTVLDIIQDGMKFFNLWANDVLETFPNVKLTGPSQKVFLAWQTWELRRITHFGFTHLCADFLNVHLEFVIYPHGISGSAVETLFSQFKYLTGGKLSSVKYETARAAYLTKVYVYGRKFKDEYRNAPLYIEQSNPQSL